MGKTNNYAECTKTLNKSFVAIFENESFIGIDNYFPGRAEKLFGPTVIIPHFESTIPGFSERPLKSLFLARTLRTLRHHTGNHNPGQE